MGIPLGAVQQKAVAAGLDGSLVAKDPSFPIANDGEVKSKKAPTISGDMLKNAQLKKSTRAKAPK